MRSSSQTEDQFASSEGVRTAEGSEAKKNKARFGFVASPALLGFVASPALLGFVASSALPER
jgi:hypothetical protein